MVSTVSRDSWQIQQSANDKIALEVSMSYLPALTFRKVKSL